MTRRDLSPTMQRAYDALPENEREAFMSEQEQMRSQMIRGAIAQVQARNTSHNAGKHVLETQKRN